MSQSSNIFIDEVLLNLWAIPVLNGCFLRIDTEPDKQEKYSPGEIDHQGHMYGVASLPNGKRSCCGSYWADFENNGCWLSLYIPIGSLASAYDMGAYPFQANEPGTSNWIVEINNWFVNIAKKIHPIAKFEIGIIGFEVDFFDVEKILATGIPSERWVGFLVVKNNQLEWFPPTRYDAPYSISKPS